MRRPQTLNASAYKLVRRLGAGGMAEVWLARYTPEDGPASDRVLKLLLPHLEEHAELVAAFVREADLCREMRHENLVAVYESGTLRGRPFIAMEYVDGVEVSALVKRWRQHRPSPGLAAYVVASVCRALTYAHQRGVIHRDIKPSNVLVSTSGEVKLVDFGVAKARDVVGDPTRTGHRKGTPGYQAPEHLAGSAIDGRADIFAAGVMLYELVTGQRPESGGKRTGGNDAMASVAPDIGRLCARAMATRPEDRFSNADELGAELSALAARLGADTAALAAEVHALRKSTSPAKQSTSTTVTAMPPRRRLWLWSLPVVVIVVLAAARAVLVVERPSNPPPPLPAAPPPDMAQPSVRLADLAAPLSLPVSQPVRKRRKPAPPTLHDEYLRDPMRD